MVIFHKTKKEALWIERTVEIENPDMIRVPERLEKFVKMREESEKNQILR